MTGHIDPTKEAFAAFRAKDRPGPIHMLNLVRFRDRAANSLVDNSVIQWCGMLGQGDDVSQYKYHNAEGVYIGTSPKSTDQPMYANDTSNNIVVKNSTINWRGLGLSGRIFRPASGRASTTHRISQTETAKIT